MPGSNCLESGAARIGKFLILAAMLVAAAPVQTMAQEPGTGSGTGGPFLLPDRIKTDTLVVLAHPDDEGVIAPLLARYALDEKQRVINIYMTSGEYGTNKVGKLKGPAFGMLRMTELHWSLDRLGIAMFHSLRRSNHLGGRDPASVFDSWDREATLAELTRIIRLTRPTRVLTWFPGPPSGHPDHMATGAAVLMACRAAGDEARFPLQIDEEGLPLHQVPEVLLFAQAEKVSYQPYPGAAEIEGEGRARIESIPVNVFSRKQGRTYTDIAREAMREQRSVEAATLLGRAGPFDAPVILVDAFRPLEGRKKTSDASGLSLVISGSPAQIFLKKLLAELSLEHLGGLYMPEVAAAEGGRTRLEFTVGNDGNRTFRGRVTLSIDGGWSVDPGEERLTLEPGAGKVVRFDLTRLDSGSLDAGGSGIHHEGTLLISSDKKKMPGLERGFVLTLPRVRKK